jgi:exodeoxyribonuclease VII large subunit
VARGGGDATSLLPWSSEEVCMAVAACPVPVVSAIGHDGDRPLCDEVADVRCGTPSIAAAHVVPDREQLVRRCDALLARSAAATLERCQRAARRHEAADPAGALRASGERASTRLSRAGDRLVWVHPRRRLAEAAARIEPTPWRRAAWEHLARAGGRLDADARHLHALSPQRVVERGYAVARTESGDVIRRIGQVSPGDAVRVAVTDGVIAATVAGVAVAEVGP